jgi:hypothetical protein
VSNHVTYQGQDYTMINPPVNSGLMGDLKQSCPGKRIEITANGRTKTVSLSELRLDGE